MNPLWLVFIIPASAAVGAVVMAFMTVASREDDEMERWSERGGVAELSELRKQSCSAESKERAVPV